MDFNDPRLQEPPVPLVAQQVLPPAPPPAQVAPAGDPMQDPGFRAFIAQRAQQMQELKAAQEQAAQNRNSLGSRVGNFLSLLGGANEAEMQGRYARQGQPVADVLARQQAGRDITAGGTQEQTLESTARQNQLAVMAQDPNSALSRRSQMLIAPIVGPDVARHLAHADIDLALKATKEGGDLSKILAEAAKTRAEGGKVEAETAQVAPNAQVERGLKVAETGQKGAETGKIGAETRKIEMETGGQVAPGWVPTPGVQHTQEEAKDFRNHWAATQTINESVDRIAGIVGDKDFIANPQKRAQVQPELAKLVFAVKEAAGIRGLPQADIQQIDKLFGDPTKWTVGNLLGLSQNATRMQAFKDQANRELGTLARSKGYAKVGGQEQSAPPPTGGRVNVFDPGGKPINLPSGQVDAYLAAHPGARRG